MITQAFLKIALTGFIGIMALLAIQLIWSPNVKVDVMSWVKKPFSALPVVTVEPEPQIKITIVSEPSFYTKGVEIEGTEWEPWMKRCYLVLENIGDHDIYDLKIQSDLPSGIVSIKERYSSNCESASSYQPIKPEGFYTDQGKVLPLKGYRRELEVTIARISHEGKYCVGLILLDGETDGKISLTCRYQNRSKSFTWESKAILPPNAYKGDIENFSKGRSVVEYTTDRKEPKIL